LKILIYPLTKMIMQVVMLIKVSCNNNLIFISPHPFSCFNTYTVTLFRCYFTFSEALITAINEYARELGFTRTYIPSEHVGLYEQYGYEYLQDIVNYGGGTDRLYVMNL